MDDGWRAVDAPKIGYYISMVPNDTLSVWPIATYLAKLQA